MTAEDTEQADFQQGVSTAIIAGMTMASDPEYSGLPAGAFMLRLREGLEDLAYRHLGEKWRPVLLEKAEDLYDDYGCPNDRWSQSDVIAWLGRGWDGDRAIQVAVGNALRDDDLVEAAAVLSDSTRLSPIRAKVMVDAWHHARFRTRY